MADKPRKTRYAPDVEDAARSANKEDTLNTTMEGLASNERSQGRYIRANGYDMYKSQAANTALRSLLPGGTNKLIDQVKSKVKEAEVPEFRRGGRVKKTGLAKVHKGERVLTRSQAKRYPRARGKA